MSSRPLVGLALGVSSPPTSLASPGAIGSGTPAAITGTTITANGGAFIATPVVLVDGATVNINAALGNLFTITLAGDRTFAAPTNPTNGQTIRIRALSTAVRTNTWNAVFAAGRADLPAFTRGNSEYDYWVFEYNSTAVLWHCQAGS